MNGGTGTEGGRGGGETRRKPDMHKSQQGWPGIHSIGGRGEIESETWGRWGGGRGEGGGGRGGVGEKNERGDLGKRKRRQGGDMVEEEENERCVA